MFHVSHEVWIMKWRYFAYISACRCIYLNAFRICIAILSFLPSTRFAFDLNKIRWLWCIVALCKRALWLRFPTMKKEREAWKTALPLQNIWCWIFFSFLFHCALVRGLKRKEKKKSFVAEQKSLEKKNPPHYKSVVCDKLSWIIRTLSKDFPRLCYQEEPYAMG